MPSHEQVKEWIRLGNKCVDRTDPLNVTLDIPSFQKYFPNEEDAVEFLKLFMKSNEEFWREAVTVMILEADINADLTQGQAWDMAGRLTEVEDDENGVVFYRGWFYRLHHSIGVDPLSNAKKVVTVMSDQNGDVHSIFAEGKILCTKEI
jgi:hypothetical protein